MQVKPDGKSLIESWNPSSDSEAKAFEDQTALHLSCRKGKCMYVVCMCVYII